MIGLDSVEINFFSKNIFNLKWQPLISMQNEVHFGDHRPMWFTTMRLTFHKTFNKGKNTISKFRNIFVEVIIIITWLSNIFVHIIFWHCTRSLSNMSSHSIHLQLLNKELLRSGWMTRCFFMIRALCQCAFRLWSTQVYCVASQ